MNNYSTMEDIIEMDIRRTEYVFLKDEHVGLSFGNGHDYDCEGIVVSKDINLFFNFLNK